MLSKLPNPFRNLDKPREVFAWGLYDLANQSFTLLIITLLFPIYFKTVAVGDEQRGDALWSAGVSAALFTVVLLSPFVGAYADACARRKLILMTTGAVCSLLTILLAIVSPGQWWLGLLLFIPANVCYQLGENLLASFLPALSTPRTIGRISAIGWSMGYLGSLILLLLVISGVQFLNWLDPIHWRWFFVLAGAWFFIWMIPAGIVVSEPKPDHQNVKSGGIKLAINRFRSTLREASHFQQLKRFLIAFFIYGLGVQTMIAFAAILASDFGIQEKGLFVFTLQIAVTAGGTAIVVSKFQDRIGVKPTIAIFLVIWILSTGGLLLTKSLGLAGGSNQWIFWVLGNGIGIGLGGIGTSSRAMVGLFAPTRRVGEFFGLWGMTYKLAGAIGVLSFGQVKAWIGDVPALLLLTSFFALGLVMLISVSVPRGIRAAKQADRQSATV
ncbi:MAG: MFS transporter [Phycisphaerales bacterium]|nr:MFS transporter [Phycisphaerales bacterium]